MAEQQTNPPSYPPHYYQDDEITLKELLLKIKEFGGELWRQKLWLLVFSGLFAGAFVLRAYLQKTYYRSGINFMVTEAGSEDFNPYGNMDFEIVSNNKVTELARSGRIIYDVLLKKSVVDGQRNLLGNHLIDIYDLHEVWGEESLVDKYAGLHLKDFYFTRTELDSFSQKERRALSVLHELVAGSSLQGEKGIMSISYNDDTEIFKLNVRALNENASIELIDAIYDELKDFYIEETVGKPEATFSLVQQQTDSLRIELDRAERGLASVKDRNRNVYSSLSSISIGQQEREVALITQEYQESFRMQKKLELLLNQQTPKFQVIDRTFFPIEDAPSRLKSLMMGLLLGGFLGSIWVIGRKIVKDALSS